MRGSFASRPARRLSLERRIAGRPSSPCRDEHQMFVARPEDSRLGQKKGKSSTLPNFPERSEEHTSELQSLMRISYAVFCLKKKKTKQDVHGTEDNTSNNRHTTSI